MIWEARRDGLRLYVDGKHVGTVSHDQLPALLLTLAGALRHRPEH